MTVKEILVKRWWLVALVGLFVIGAVNSKNTDSNSSSKSYYAGPKCDWCGRKITSNYSQIEDYRYVDLKFCNIDCAHFYSSANKP